MVKHPLANVLLATTDFTRDYSGLYYRTGDGLAIYDESAGHLAIQGLVSFATYFNALPVSKWCRYTKADSFFLQLEIEGAACEVLFVEMDEAVCEHRLSETPLAFIAESACPASIEIALPKSNAPLVSFAIRSEGEVHIKAARYVACLSDSDVRSVRLALCTTTFKKEEFIVPNIEAVKREILGCDEPISKNFHMFVIDNGRTLDAEFLSGDGVTIAPNDNVGGAGGFARGMIESLDIGATHVLLMDDDVRVSPESFKRTFNLLSLVNDEYVDAFLNGAMLALERPNLQYEDVAYVREDGIYDRVKPDLIVDRASDVVKNEIIDVEVANAYGAWWFCCMPTDVIRKHGLPLPVFVRCDDVEFGMRCKPRMMSMSGICVWHASFEGRFRASIDCYQYVRNFLIMIAVDDVCSERLFMMRFNRTFHILLRAMDYGSAELMLDGLEDYLKGPSFIEDPQGEEILKRNALKNEKLVPLEELDPEIVQDLEIDRALLGAEDTRGLFIKLIEALPHDRHMLPDLLLRNNPTSMYYCRGAYPGWKTMARKTLVAVDLSGEKGHVRQIDKGRYRELMKRYRSIRGEMREKGKGVAQSYKEAKPYLTSRRFWEKYLGIR